MEYLLLNVENIRVYHVRSAGSGLLAGHHHLLLKDSLEVFDIDSRNARFGNQFIQDALWLVLRITVLNVQTKFLFVEFLTASRESYLNGHTTIGSNGPLRWVD